MDPPPTRAATGERPRPFDAVVRRGGLVTFAVALAARLAVVVWAAGRFPPTADGKYYETIAERIAQGLGYTWLWPDGAVTYAAHYPVGYPALAGAVYALVGPRPAAAMALNALLGALAALAAHRLAARAAGPRLALASGLAVALHPGLVAYTPAIMTEGVTAAFVISAAAVAAWARDRERVVLPAVAVGLIVGVATLVRPQSLVLAPIFGLLAGAGSRNRAPAKQVEPRASASGPEPRASASGPYDPAQKPDSASLPCPSPASLTGRGRAGSRRMDDAETESWMERLVPLLTRGAPVRLLTRAVPLRAAAIATVAALLVCAPWTARNCVRMHHCALVSVNGGWNLLIGADAESTGAWSPIKVPAACREVFDEAQKDLCFGREARRYIRENPAAWVELVPKKLAATFDYAGAAPWYLHDANAAAFPYADKERLGALETLYERAVLLLCLGWAARRVREDEPSARRWVRVGIAAVGGAFVFALHAWVGYAALVVAALLRGRSLWTGPVLASSAVAVLGATIATHAAFFGAGRYSLVVFPLLTALAPLALQSPKKPAP